MSKHRHTASIYLHVPHAQLHTDAAKNKMAAKMGLRWMTSDHSTRS